MNRAGRWGRFEGFEGVISIQSMFAVRPSDSLKDAQYSTAHTEQTLHLTLTTGHTHHANLSILTQYTSECLPDSLTHRGS